MASHQDFVDYVVEQLREAGAIRSRKMFGEYDPSPRLVDARFS